MATTSAPSSATTAATSENVPSAVDDVGVSTHTAPLNIAPSAPSSPSSSLPAIGMSADEPRIRHGGGDRSLHASDVGDHAARLGERPLDLVGDGEHRDGDERDGGRRIDTAAVDAPSMLRLLDPRRVDVVAGDLPAGLTEGERDGAADQPQADDVGQPRLIHGAQRTGWVPRAGPGQRRLGRGRVPPLP